VLLHLVSGYRPIATFRAARAVHAVMLQRIAEVGQGRFLPETIPFDLTDFAMAAGWIGVLLAGYGLARRDGDGRRLGWLAVVQIVVVAGTGLLQGETFRVWLFLLPLLMLPIGLELRRWSRAQRTIAYACLLLLTFAVGQNMVFNAWTMPVE
jgi:hypothetical protein